jgi:Transposase domain (DUF772)
MIASTHHQSWIFFLPLAQQASLLKDDLLDPVDQLLDDPELVELVRQRLARRYPKSSCTGREGIAPDRLRCCVLKHLKGWSFRGLERELRSNLIYRRFTHYDAEATPGHSAFGRRFTVLGPFRHQGDSCPGGAGSMRTGRRSGSQTQERYDRRYCDIVLYLAILLKTLIVACHHSDFAEPTRDSSSS